MPVYTKGKLEKWFNIFIENPLKTYWQGRKYFKFPKIKINFFSHPRHNCPYASFKWIGKIFDIQCHDVMWKRKYNTICYERSPYIWICFFKRFGFSINFYTCYKDEFNDIQNLDIWYWEYLLDHVIDNIKLSKAFSVCYGTSKLYYTRNFDTGKKKYFENCIPIVANSLNKNGIKQLKKELNNENGNSNS